MSNIDYFFFNLACEDEPQHAANCPNWAQVGECSNNPAFMLDHCKNSCNENCGGGKFF